MTNRFRPTYRELTDDEKLTLDKIKSAASHMEELYQNVKDPRYKALAITSLEETVMWAVKGVTG